MKDFNKVFACNCNGDLNQRWFVYWYSIVDGKRKRVRDYGGINKIKDFGARIDALNSLKDQRQILIDAGIHKLIQGYTSNNDNIGQLIIRVINEKKQYITKKSHVSHRVHLMGLLEFFTKTNLHNKPIEAIRQHHMLEFRNYLLQKKLSNRSVNNYFLDIKAMFNYLYRKIESYSSKNPCIGIEALPAKSETHVRYTQAEAQKIRDWLIENDKTLYLFCQFITYTFLRPNEIRQLKVNQIDLQSMRLTRMAANHKTGKRKMQIIQSIFLPALAKLKLHETPQDYYLFGSKHIPGNAPFCESYFTKRFKKCKTALGFSNRHTMYGLKHTFICHLKQNGATDNELMGVTGHETQHALHKYLRDIGAIDVKDLSALYSFEF